MTPKTVLITGASSGIGEGLAHRFAHEGHSLVLLARREDVLSKLAEKLKTKGVRAISIPCDVTQKPQVVAAVKRAKEELGQIDIAIANAGIGLPSPSISFESTPYEKVFQTNLFGAIHLIEAVLPDMLTQKSGQLVGIGSLAAYLGLPGAGAYCASKAALWHMFQSLRIDLKPKGITVTIIHPGYIKTPLTDRNDFPMPFLMPLDKGIEKIYMAIEKQKREYAFPWQLAIPAHLSRLCPRWLVDSLLSGRDYQKN